MDKRYQVFISSTYSDLKEERSKVMQTIMSLDCIPAGMELFPAIDAEQFEFIKKIIDDCDYYVLIIGGRYGSISDDGISYTEKEYNYAISKNIHVLAFLHEDIKKLTFEKSESNPENRNKLEVFREKVSNGRLVQFWNNADELNGKVAVSLMKTIKMYPAIGWVRANLQSNTESLQEINTLRKKIETLEIEKTELLEQYKFSSKITNIASLEESITIKGTDYTSGSGKISWELETTWERLFALISPFFLIGQTDNIARKTISSILAKEANGYTSMADIEIQDFQTIKVQYMTLGLIDIIQGKTSKNNDSISWKLTTKGIEYMKKLRVVKTTK